MGNEDMEQPTLLLASTSIYRRDLLQKLGIPFVTAAPLIDEEKEKDPRLAPRALAEHLAELKTRSLANPKHLVLGGDQLVSFEGKILGKPGTKKRAVEMLMAMSGKTHELITAICLLKHDGTLLKHVDHTIIRFKTLTPAQIERCVDRDNPVDCAGSYKMESFGIALVEELQTQDFTAIQGLPLIALSRMLKECGIEVLTS